MTAGRFLEGCGIPLRRNNVDTDQIMPARFSYNPTRTGHGDSLFGDWRLDPVFVLNDPRYQGANILVAGREFATGSSREYAVWALKDYGIRVVIAPSFGDIFYKNALQNRLLPVIADEKTVSMIWQMVEDEPNRRLTIDLEKSEIALGEFSAAFELPVHCRERFERNQTDLEETLQYLDEIKRYEQDRPGTIARTR